MFRKVIMIMLSIVSLVIITGCGVSNVDDINDDSENNVQIANPASTFCIENGGESEIMDTGDGQVGRCNFSDGSTCDEWAFYRGECAIGDSLDYGIDGKADSIVGYVVAVDENTIDVVSGDIAERFTYDGDLSGFVEGDTVKMRVTGQNYNEKVIINIEHTDIEVVDFESCVAAGNPVMESYPMQCTCEGKTYVQEIHEEIAQE